MSEMLTIAAVARRWKVPPEKILQWARERPRVRPPLELIEKNGKAFISLVSMATWEAELVPSLVYRGKNGRLVE
jgi:hypothetical protein